MKRELSDDIVAFVDTAAQSGGYVWVLTIVDFSDQQIKRTAVCQENYPTQAAAQDAGDVRLKALEGKA